MNKMLNITCLSIVTTNVLATLPCGHTRYLSSNSLENYGNKKDVGVNSSVPIPVLRPSHCPYLRISN